MKHDDRQGEEQLIRQRQKGRAIVMAVLLGGFVLLVFAITIVKIKAGIAAR
ncbi:MAG: hypothetical protein JO221_02835 [Sphingomonas sp.]|nr:hypothetical protein [Sphingomonas sp.]